MDYGPELVANGDFGSGDTGWVKGTGWAIAAGVASHTGGSSGELEQDIGINAGRLYELTFTVSGYSSGAIGPQIGAQTGTQRNANGTYTETITAVDASNLVFIPVTTFVGSLDDISVKEVKQYFVG